MKIKCPYCGHENIAGADHCDKCLHSFTQKDLPTPGKDKVQKLIMTETVSNFISKIPPIIVSPETSVQEVIDKMQALPMKGCVLICNSKKKLLGIASIRDILLKVAGIVDEKKRNTFPVKNILTGNVFRFFSSTMPATFSRMSRILAMPRSFFLELQISTQPFIGNACILSITS